MSSSTGSWPKMFAAGRTQLAIGCLAMAWVCPLRAYAELELVAGAEAQIVFAEGARDIRLIWRNTGDQAVETAVSFQLYQASSSLAGKLAEGAWKRLRVPPGQTVLESATLPLPAVRTETHFVVRWLDGQSRLLGITELVAVPTNLLCELSTLAGDQPLGLLDPQARLQPLLRRLGVVFEPLDLEGLARYRGRLAIVCSAPAGPDDAQAVVAQTGKCRQTGANVVWFRHLSPQSSLPAPVCLVRSGAGSLVVCDASELAHIADSAPRQRDLLSIARLAVNPEASVLFQP